MSRKDFKFENYLEDLKKMSHEKLLAHAAVTGNALHIEQRKVEEARSDTETMLTELRALNEYYLINRFKLEKLEKVEDERDQLEAEVADLRERLVEMENERDEASKDADQWREVAELNGRHARTYLTDLETANQRADNFEESVAALEKELQALKSDYDDSRNELGRLRAELAKARSLRNRLGEDLDDANKAFGRGAWPETTALLEELEQAKEDEK